MAPVLKAVTKQEMWNWMEERRELISASLKICRPTDAVSEQGINELTRLLNVEEEEEDFNGFDPTHFEDPLEINIPFQGQPKFIKE